LSQKSRADGVLHCVKSVASLSSATALIEKRYWRLPAAGIG